MIEVLLVIILILLQLVLFVSIANSRHVNNFIKLIQQGQSELMVGTPAPFFEAHLLDSTKVTLRDIEGRNVLFLFIAPTCKSCKDALKFVDTVSNIIKEEYDLEPIGVSEGSMTETRILIKEHDISMPVFVAPKSENLFTKTYNPKSQTPYYCIIDSEGIVKERGLTVDGRWTQYESIWRSKLTTYNQLVDVQS